MIIKWTKQFKYNNKIKYTNKLLSKNYNKILFKKCHKFIVINLRNLKIKK